MSYTTLQTQLLKINFVNMFCFPELLLFRFTPDTHPPKIQNPPTQNSKSTQPRRNLKMNKKKKSIREIFLEFSCYFHFGSDAIRPPTWITTRPLAHSPTWITWIKSRGLGQRGWRGSGVAMVWVGEFHKKKKNMKNMN